MPLLPPFHEQVLPSLKREYIDTGLVRFVHKASPLFHRPARGRCGCSPMRRRTKPPGICTAPFSINNLPGMQGRSRDRQIQGSTHQLCRSLHATGSNRNSDHRPIFQKPLHNIRATPTFVIGPSRKAGNIGDIVEGAMPWPQFKALIDQQLIAQKEPLNRLATNGITKMHHAVRDDRLWFQTNPVAIVRFRTASPGEFTPLFSMGEHHLFPAQHVPARGTPALGGRR